jgi:hypothetical protein
MLAHQLSRELDYLRVLGRNMPWLWFSRIAVMVDSGTPAAARRRSCAPQT